MKKKFYLLATTVLLCFMAFNSNAATLTDNNAVTKEAAANMTAEQKQARLEEINIRVHEIKAMDKSQLTKEDRRELRDELKSMKKESRAMGSGGIYLSVGAIIIIILVLILIL